MSKTTFDGTVSYLDDLRVPVFSGCKDDALAAMLNCSDSATATEAMRAAARVALQVHERFFRFSELRRDLCRRPPKYTQGGALMRAMLGYCELFALKHGAPCVPVLELPDNIGVTALEHFLDIASSIAFCSRSYWLDGSASAGAFKSDRRLQLAIPALRKEFAAEFNWDGPQGTRVSVWGRISFDDFRHAQPGADRLIEMVLDEAPVLNEVSPRLRFVESVV